MLPEGSHRQGNRLVETVCLDLYRMSHAFDVHKRNRGSSQKTESRLRLPMAGSASPLHLLLIVDMQD